MSSNVVQPLAKEFEFGVYTFGDLLADPVSKQKRSPARRLKDIIAAAKLADEVGLDVFGLGEHHKPDFAISSPAVVLAAIAQATQRIKLTSMTTVLSILDPVRVFEDYATVDLLSAGRAEIVAGRGAKNSLDAYELFGCDLASYESLFDEKIDLLLQCVENESVTWEGQFRSSLTNVAIVPRPLQKELPVWLGMGGTLESAVRAGKLGRGALFALLTGDPARLQSMAEAYRQAGLQAGHDASRLPIAVASHGCIASEPGQAWREFSRYYENYVGRFLPKINEGIPHIDPAKVTAPQEGLAVGTPEQIAEKILFQHELIGHNRFILQVDIGELPFENVATTIQLLATEVAPIVRREIARRKSKGMEEVSIY
ncbi:LLM class flavin-dependent oxidoreductase [Paenibacillus sp. HWE-109]|uniref:LLM class flavin-dependent oxidoreductase n=1 Tax=Paenibacillus sp. HWE-109 TaxID=1306526 RepID=UPI001EE103D1|nr:LLM class flavin-dependent oxidoreductase [Paenibacillus sp. HWE-109]UKS24056.1 LLM class flavin-dependent oxidoreductase [Paenibacillus sp. HWE-109]